MPQQVTAVAGYRQLDRRRVGGPIGWSGRIRSCSARDHRRGRDLTQGLVALVYTLVGGGVIAIGLLEESGGLTRGVGIVGGTFTVGALATAGWQQARARRANDRPPPPIRPLRGDSPSEVRRRRARPARRR